MNLKPSSANNIGCRPERNLGQKPQNRWQQQEQQQLKLKSGGEDEDEDEDEVETEG